MKKYLILIIGMFFLWTPIMNANIVISYESNMTTTDSKSDQIVMPVIQGDNFVPCTGTKTYTLSGGYVGNWEVSSSGLELVSGGQQTNSITVRYKSNAGGTASGTLYATVRLPDNSEGRISKIVDIGAPRITSISGPTSARVGSSASYSASPSFTSTYGDYEWIVSPSTASQSAYRSTNSVTFNAPGSYMIGCRSTSACTTPGTYTRTTVTVTDNYYSVTPNPTDGAVNIVDNGYDESAFEVKGRTSQERTYHLYNQNTGVEVAKGIFNKSGANLDFSKYPSGIYILKINIREDWSETHRIIIK